MPERKRLHKTDDLAVERPSAETAVSPAPAPLKVAVPAAQGAVAPAMAGAAGGGSPIAQLREQEVRRLAGPQPPSEFTRPTRPRSDDLVGPPGSTRSRTGDVEVPESRPRSRDAGVGLTPPPMPKSLSAQAKLETLLNPESETSDLLTDANRAERAGWRQDNAVTLSKEITDEAKATGGGARVATPESMEHAKTLLALAQKEKDTVVGLVQEICTSGGGKQEGAEFATKGLDGLAGKIGEEMEALTKKGHTAQGAARQIDVAALVGDALRFTIVFPFDGFTDNVLNAMGKLEAAKYKSEKIGNTFLKSGATYRGINTNWRKVDKEGNNIGVKWELQFHTADSFDVKQNTNHASYEGARAVNLDKNPNDPRKKLLDKHMAKVSSGIATPEGLEMVGIQRPRSKGEAPPLPEGINKIKEK